MSDRKKLHIGHLYIVIISMFFIACDGSEDAAGVPSLSFVESSIPVPGLSADGGSIFIEVDWAHTRWNISAGDVVAGNAFITEVAPSYAGAPEQSTTKTKIKITFKSNNTIAANRQEVKVKSLTDNLSHSIVLTQLAKSIVPTNITINPGITYQTIAGFGGGNTMWGTNFLTTSELKSAFGTEDTDLGLSIFRVRISPVASEWQSLVATLKEAKKYNARIIASPWSPPANLKSNNNLVGGHLLEANYAAYATHLNNFVQYMASEGVAIDVVSIQNEPDISVSYESCDWTSAQMLSFIKINASSITGTKVAAAESFNFKQSFTNVFLNDADAVDKFSVVAGHIYGGGLAAYPLAQQKGKEIWMTEYLMNQNSGANPNNWIRTDAAIWNESMQMLQGIHTSMSYNWNAYIWWYIRRYYSFLGDGEQGTTSGTVLKRGYGISQFSKFVRPGYVRVNAQAATPTGLNITAYNGDGKIVVVIINPTEDPVYSVNLSGPGVISSATSYTTSVSLNREKQVLTPADNKVTIDVTSKGITTIVLGL
jgi:glucuronoarabinoxylan endo-1,4-beta-xylanase